MKKFDKIKLLAEDLTNELETIQERRETWAKQIKQRIQKNLEDIKTSTDLDWYVGINDIQENHESVFLSFPDKHSGILESNSEGKPHTSLAKKPGYLCYSQTYNGKITVWLKYPQVEKIQPEREPKMIESIEPNEIVSDKFIQHVEMFLQEMISYEQDEEQVKIGF